VQTNLNFIFSGDNHFYYWNQFCLRWWAEALQLWDEEAKLFNYDMRNRSPVCCFVFAAGRGIKGLSAYYLTHSNEVTFNATCAPTRLLFHCQFKFQWPHATTMPRAKPFLRLHTRHDKQGQEVLDLETEATLVGLWCICSGMYPMSRDQATILSSSWPRKRRQRIRWLVVLCTSTQDRLLNASTRSADVLLSVSGGRNEVEEGTCPRCPPCSLSLTATSTSSQWQFCWPGKTTSTSAKQGLKPG